MHSALEKTRQLHFCGSAAKDFPKYFPKEAELVADETLAEKVYYISKCVHNNGKSIFDMSPHEYRLREENPNNAIMLRVDGAKGMQVIVPRSEGSNLFQIIPYSSVLAPLVEDVLVIVKDGAEAEAKGKDRDEMDRIKISDMYNVRKLFTDIGQNLYHSTIPQMLCAPIRKKLKALADLTDGNLVFPEPKERESEPEVEFDLFD